MSPLERSYRLLMRAFPTDYRREREEEMIGTLLDAADATRTRPTLREAVDLLRAAARVRWRIGTQGSLRATWSQGLRWGATVWLVYVAARMVAELVLHAPYWLRPGEIAWAVASNPAALLCDTLLPLVWLASLLLTVAGPSLWAAGGLAVALIVQAAVGSANAISYGEPLNLWFTLKFFVPMSVPLLPLLMPRTRPVSNPRRSVVKALLAVVILAAVVWSRQRASLMEMNGDASSFLILVSKLDGPEVRDFLQTCIPWLVVVAAWFDPRIAVAAGMLTINATMYQVLRHVYFNQFHFGVGWLYEPALWFAFVALANYRSQQAVRI